MTEWREKGESAVKHDRLCQIGWVNTESGYPGGPERCRVKYVSDDCVAHEPKLVVMMRGSL